MRNGACSEGEWEVTGIGIGWIPSDLDPTLNLMNL